MRLSFSLKGPRWSAAGAYAGAVALCLLLLAWVQDLRHADLAVPFVYHGDSLFVQMLVKGAIDNGWHLHNPRVGMPGGLDMNDYPMPDNLHLFGMKLISLVARDYAVTFNLYYLLTYPLTTISALFVLRRFTRTYAVAVVGSLLFTFLPYHFFRGEGHLFLAAYYLVPPMILVILRFYQDGGPLFQREEERGGGRLRLLGWRSLATVAICLLVASAGVYYAFFACFFLLVAGIDACFYQCRRYPLWTALALVAVIGAGLLANLTPTFVYRYYHGSNPVAVRRLPMDSEFFGMKIAQLVLPISGHRLAALAHLKNKYNTSMMLITENDASSLGVVGSLGFLVLLGWPLLRSRLASLPRLQDGLAVLNASGLLLASVGGFGGLFSLFISRNIRCYNRVSVYLAFFAVLTVALLLERFLHRQLLAGKRRVAGYAILAAILVVGLLDQTSVNFAPPHASLKKTFQNDAAFVQAIEAVVPANAMIFQLPNMPFPEAPFAAGEMQDYDLFRGYLHSKTLRWSYGSIKGREGDQWRTAVAALPLEHIVAVVARAGYSGIYVDRLGYADHGSQLLSDLSRALGTRPLFSPDERLVFFSLAEYNRRLSPVRYSSSLAAQR